MKTYTHALTLVVAALALCGLASAGLAACGGARPHHSTDLAAVSPGPAPGPTDGDGTVTGRYLMEGGPIRAGTGQVATPWPIDGQVTFAAGGRSANVTAGRSGDFTIRLAPGIYTVTARTPHVITTDQSESRCSLPQTVAVQRGVTTNIAVYCAVP